MLRKLGEVPEDYKIINAETAADCGIEAVELIKGRGGIHYEGGW